jgi:cytochrome P450
MIPRGPRPPDHSRPTPPTSALAQGVRSTSAPALTRVLSRDADVLVILRDPRFGRGGFRQRIEEIVGGPIADSFSKWMLFLDPPDHAWLRVLVSRAFTPRAVENLQPHHRDDLLSALVAAEEQGDKLSEDELLATCVPIFFAGHETTVDLIGHACAASLPRISSRGSRRTRR